MSDPGPAAAVAVLGWARERTGPMLSLLRELVEIESPSNEPTAVGALAGRLVGELTASGLAVELRPVPGLGPVLRAALPGRPPGVMLLGHLDTVWPLGTVGSRRPRAEGDRYLGPGTYDMKAGLVVAVFALRALAERGPLPPVNVFLSPNEEEDSRPYLPDLQEAMRASTAVLGLEPAWPGGGVKTERKGSGSFLVRARGRSAHAGSSPGRGANAIVELSRHVAGLNALGDPDRGLTVNVGVFRGGIRSNVVPELAELEMDFRVRSAADARLVEEAVGALRPFDAGVTLEVEGGLRYPPLERTPPVVALYERARVVADSLGLPLEEVSSGGASEASFAAALGLPVLDGLGPDGDGAHAEHEQVRISSLPERVALLAGLLGSLEAEPLGA